MNVAEYPLGDWLALNECRNRNCVLPSTTSLNAIYVNPFIEHKMIGKAEHN